MVLLGLHRMAGTLVVMSRCKLELHAVLQMVGSALSMRLRVVCNVAIYCRLMLMSVEVKCFLNYLTCVFAFRSVLLNVVTVSARDLFSVILHCFLTWILFTMADG